jgi:hypothetical protein
MEMVADELSEERDKRRIAFGKAILKSCGQVDFPCWIGSLNFFGDDDSIGFDIIFVGRLQTLRPGDGRFESVVWEI